MSGLVEPSFLRIENNFLSKFSRGVLIQSLSSKGIRDILIKITERKFSYGPPDSRRLLSIQLQDISAVTKGLPSHLVGVYNKEGISTQAFHISLINSSSVATFITPSSRHRDVLVKGLSNIISTNARPTKVP